ncbi:DUF881 domain-containing protein [Kitasatospora sp. NBC_01287]|uniref:DUF881 domain-containing protein n=1 Tax=Kitasatospora sp. NBC_01287 TaxID=2903573 RepID=UPI00224E8D12|nr:DUF881 domain-containing protein [Kitasatospora sp. NBC_01287]MCX4750767.1 DUF881 domain-containing protein [Kitasatospora sp. NBC_01287]
MSATRPPVRGSGRFARPDASMRLLTTVMDQSLDEGYAAAARARGEVGERRLPTTTRGRLLLSLGLALAAVVVTVSGVTAHDDEPVLAKQHDALVQKVTDETAAADKLQRQVEAARTQVAQQQQRALREPGGDVALTDLSAAVGTGAVRGPGLKLVLDDAAGTDSGGGVDPRTGDDFTGGRLHDRDLQLIVNGLWEAGAEAVSVNGQRLTALSAIRAAGDAILVDNRPLVPPYTVLAVGDEKRLPGAFQNSMGGRYLKVLQDSYGIKATASAQHSLDLPAAVGFTLRLAAPDTGAPTVPPSAAPTATRSPGAAPAPASSGRPSPSGSAVPSASPTVPAAPSAAAPSRTVPTATTGASKP